MSQSEARRSLFFFSVLFLVASAALELAIMRRGPTLASAGPLVLALMWTPGLASLAVRLFRREGIGDASFRFGGRRGAHAIAVVVAYPMVVGVIAYGLAWATSLATFAPPVSTMGIRPGSDAGRFFVRLAFALLPGVPLSLIAALGEEIGWRGYFLPRLVAAGVRRPLFVSGLVWGLWHVPLIASGHYAVGPYPLLSSVVFLASVMAASYLFGWARLYSGSLWPAALAHAAWNSIIQGVFDASTVGSSSLSSTNIWVGESGLLVAGASLVVVGTFLKWRKQGLALAAAEGGAMPLAAPVA